MELIKTILVPGVFTTVTFTSIPQTYKHLIIMASAVSNTSGHTLAMTLNGITTSGGYEISSPYYGGGLNVNGASAAAYFDLMLLGDTSVNYGAGTILIPNYTATNTSRNIIGTNTHEGGTGYYGGFSPSGVTNVTSITFTKTSLTPGTTISLYGVK